MSYQTPTIAIIIVATLGLSAYDIIPATNAVSGDTISEVLRRWGREWIVIAFIWGGLGGHFWGGVPHDMWTMGQELKLTFWSVWVVFIFNLGMREQIKGWPWWCFLIAIMAGALVFSVTWSQA